MPSRRMEYMRPSFVMEALENRTLFAGVILEATGRLGGTNGWIQSLAETVTNQLGGPAQVPQYVLSINEDPATENLVPSIQHVSGTGTPQTSSSGEIIVVIDYYNISANPIYSSTYIGSVIANYMLNTPVDGIQLASLPIHEIGVSRGTAIMDGVSKTLGQAGVWVDQETDLDPDPIAAQGDPPSTIFDNVAFVDNYWRNDGSASQINDGDPIDGAYNLNVYWIDTDDAGYSTPHLAPSGYYIGTIDPTATYGGEGPIYSDWYGNTPTMPPRTETGWIYSNLIGAARPLSGVWAASGGTGARTAAGQVGNQWANATDLAATASGNSLDISYIHQDRDSADTITFYLDTDRNPYNNNFAATLGTSNLAEAPVATGGAATLSAAGVTPGAYWVCAKITDAQGNTRYTYTTATVTTPQTTQTSGSIKGTVFNDVNGNGALDAGELGLAGQMVYVDLNGSGQYESADPSATTDANGNYIINGVTPGTPYTVREVLQPGSRETTAPSGPVTVSAGQTVTIADFGVAQSPGAISGKVFDDLNANGVLDAGEPGLAGQVVYVDLDGSDQFKTADPSATTDANGNYTITGLTAGVPYTVREVVPAGTRETTAPMGSVTVSAGQTVTIADFGTTVNSGSITGTVFNDLNGNGVLDAGEPGFAGQVVYIDLDGSGQYETTDPSATTDANGNYTIADLAPGTPFTVREVVPLGRRETAAPSAPVTVIAGQTLTIADFATTLYAGAISGTVFNDLNGNGVLDPGEPGLANQLVYVDLDGSGAYETTDPSARTDANGNYTINSLTPGVPYAIREVVPAGTRETTAPSAPVMVTVGQTLTVADFGTTVAPGAISGTVFNDLNGNGVLDAGEPGLAGELVYIDLDGSGQYKAPDPSATTDANGDYTIAGLTPGVPYTVHELVSSGTYETSARLAPVTVGAGQTVTIAGFGVTRNAGAISGTVFNDRNGNGVLDAGEPGFAGQVVYVDVNGSGRYEANDPSATTDANGNYTITGVGPAAPRTVREVVPPGTRQTAAPTAPVTVGAGQTVTIPDFALTQSAAINGVVAVNGASPAGFEVILTQHPKHGKATREVESTDADGTFAFNGLLAGAQETVQIVKRKGFKLAPRARGVYTLRVTTGQVVSGLTFSQVPILPAVKRRKAAK